MRSYKLLWSFRLLFVQMLRGEFEALEAVSSDRIYAKSEIIDHSSCEAVAQNQIKLEDFNIFDVGNKRTLVSLRYRVYVPFLIFKFTSYIRHNNTLQNYKFSRARKRERD